MLPGAGSGPPPRILLNSNESAFGPSPQALAAASAALGALHRYVEFQDSDLAPAIAAHHGLDPDWVTIGPGSDDLLARLARAWLGPGDQLLRWAKGYLKVPNYGHANGAEVVSVDGAGFAPPTDTLIAAITPRTRIVYVASPDNPAGTYVPERDLARIADALPPGALLVIDAAYLEYVDAPDAGDPMALAAARSNVVVSRTFSKVHGLAGARVGWIFARPEVIDPVRRIGLTFPLSTPSLHAARAALEDTGHAAHVVSETRRLRRWLTDALAALGLAPVPSQGNFVLVRFPEGGPGAAHVAAALAGDGIAVRRFAAPAYDACLRITIGQEAELQAAVAALTRRLS